MPTPMQLREAAAIESFLISDAAKNASEATAKRAKVRYFEIIGEEFEG